MAAKRARSTTNSSTNISTTTTITSDLSTSHQILAPNEYSPATIGTHSCLVRCRESESFGKCFHQGSIIGLTPKDFIHRLNEMEKKFKKDCQLEIERCPMVARLRQDLEKDEASFENILKQIRNHLQQCMREDSPLPVPQTYEEFTQQCLERNQAARVHDQAHRMRRFQFHDHKDANQPVNLINLQTWTQPHFQLLVDNITPDSPNRDQFLSELKDLLNNSFFIIQHPSPRIATHSAMRNETVTANVNCRLLCLLDKSNPVMTIDNITPFVCCLTKSNQIEENDVSYRQSEMDWKTYSIVTASNNQKTFSCVELLNIALDQLSVIPQGQQPAKGKTHYAPFVYRIEFHVNITVCFPNDPSPFQHCVIIQSAPFGLITNTSQEEDLFAEVFIEDLKSWKSYINTSLLTTTNLTIEEIVDNIRRYFIHTTGIQPKQWVMPYIQGELSAVYNNDQYSMDHHFYNVLAKILAQIDYMAKHPLLALFHHDGLFMGICSSMLVDQVLRRKYELCKKPVCAIRFGGIHHMSDPKDIGVRVDVLDKSSIYVQHCTFESTKLSMELGLFIIKIALCEASRFENILSSIIENKQNQHAVVWKNMQVFVDLYHSKKLCELCPHEQRYTSIWTNFDSKENKKPNHSGSPPIPCSPQNFSITTNTGANANNNLQYLHNPNICTTNQTPQLHYPQQSPYSQPFQSQPQYYPPSPMSHQVQTTCANYSNVLPSGLASLYAPQSNQQYIHPPPVVIIIASAHQFTMSDQDICRFISCHLPQYPSVIPSDRIHRFNLNFSPQPINTSAQTLQNSVPNPSSTSFSSDQSIIYEQFTTDPTNFSQSDNNN